MPEHLVLKGINEIIYDNRKNNRIYKGSTRKQIINTKSIFKKEFLEFVETYGFPKGYKI